MFATSLFAQIGNASSKHPQLPEDRSYNDEPRTLHRQGAGQSTGNGTDERQIAYAAGYSPATPQRVRYSGPCNRCFLALEPVLSHVSWRFRNDEALARTLHLLHSNPFERVSAGVCIVVYMCGDGRL